MSDNLRFFAALSPAPGRSGKQDQAKLTPENMFGDAIDPMDRIAHSYEFNTRAWSDRREAVFQHDRSVAPTVRRKEQTTASQTTTQIDPGEALRALQARLRVGPVDDPLEREADDVADRVMRSANAPPANAVAGRPTITGSEQNIQRAPDETVTGAGPSTGTRENLGKFFSNTTAELREQVESGKPFRFTDILKAAFTTDSSTNVTAARTGMARFYASVLSDLGFNVSADSVGTAISETGEISNLIAGPDMEAVANSGDALQSGDYSGAAGYAGLAAAGIVLSKIKWVGRLGATGLKKAAPEAVINALKTFATRRFHAGDKIFTLDRSGLKHILERHHPDFWNGTVKTTQTFFDRRLGVENLSDIAGKVIRQNREAIVQSTKSSFNLIGNFGDAEVRMFIKDSRIQSMFPL